MQPDIASLFQPFEAGGMKLKNRSVMAPMGRAFARGGVQPPEAASYYAKRARGGVGLIICEATGVDQALSTDSGGAPLMHGEAALNAWKNVVDAVHAEGGVVVPQLFHQGMLRGGTVADGTMQSLRPSGTVGVIGRNSFAPEFSEAISHPTRPMNDEEIADVIAGFARSAKNAMDLGFDGIQIHGAHGYMIDSFLWKESNKRTDRYGGDAAARTTFAVEVIKAVRAVMPEGKALLFRFSQHKSSNYDARLADTPEELDQLLGPIADAGVDILDASIRRFWQPAFEGSDLNLAGWAKKLTGKPTIAVGSVGLNNSASDTFMKIGESGAADNIRDIIKRLDEGEFDLVALGRSLIGDSDYVNKLAEGLQPTPFQRKDLETLV